MTQTNPKRVVAQGGGGGSCFGHFHYEFPKSKNGKGSLGIKRGCYHILFSGRSSGYAQAVSPPPSVSGLAPAACSPSAAASPGSTGSSSRLCAWLHLCLLSLGGHWHCSLCFSWDSALSLQAPSSLLFLLSIFCSHCSWLSTSPSLALVGTLWAGLYGDWPAPCPIMSRCWFVSSPPLL